MDKRYQVFISSTFADLEEERKGVMEAIIELDCFPAGMEMFPASNMEQFDYIKSVIDESDYYVLIVAGKYGSVAEDGISYTEKEFNYAQEQGIPILAFVKKDLSNLPESKIEIDLEKREKLETFRKKVLNGRLAKLWDSGSELKYDLHSSLAREIKINPRIGWIRADSSADIKVYKTIDNLKKDIKKLKEENERLIKQNIEVSNNQENNSKISFNTKMEKHFSIEIGNGNRSTKIITTLKELINKIGYRLMYTFDSFALSSSIVEAYTGNSNEHVYENDLNQIIMKLLALDIISITEFGLGADMDLTRRGREVVLSSVIF